MEMSFSSAFIIFMIGIVFNCLTGAVDIRPSCQPGMTAPVGRVDTTTRLQTLRARFATNSIQAYIILSRDAHASEFVTEYDQRRMYISGFKGSSGVAVVTLTKAALWTDGRYFLQAENELDCNWILMKQGEPDTPSLTEWLISELTRGQAVGVSPYLLSSATWLKYKTELEKEGLSIRSIEPDIIDEIWTVDRPAESANPIVVHDIKFAGKTWQVKIADVRAKLLEAEAQGLVVTALDEIAWLFNLRGSDILYSPIFMAYAIVEPTQIRLYVKLAVTSLGNVLTQLNSNSLGQCAGRTGDCVEIRDYENIKADVTQLAQVSSITRLWVSPFCNQAVYSSIAQEKVYQEASPIALMKAVKNSVEKQGMQNAHNRDAVALIAFLAKLEKEIKEGTGTWTEISASTDLEKYRRKQENNRGLSFETISASGANGAIIHYRPEPATDRAISTTEIYLLDSGAQYLDGTTDVTRTFHFGTPSAYQKEVYTRVLMGMIDLARVVWPEGKYGRDIDALARAPIWRAGLDYNHGTGHGIGHYLGVHEGPARILLGYRESESKLYEGMYFSDEPGYYEPGQFGVRLETIVTVMKAETQYNKDDNFFKFSPVTLVPFEDNLIDTSLMRDDQLRWLNEYHELVRTVVGTTLQAQGLTDAYEWMSKRVVPFTLHSSGVTFKPSITISVLCSLITLCYFKQ